MVGMAEQKSKQYYEFKKQLKALAGFHGHGTELISVFITPKYQVSDVVQNLKEEAGQASNIKSTTTRKNVQGALEKIVQYLKTFKEPPENGIAIFCGNVSEQEGKTDLELFSIIPPVPLTTQFYRCESSFVLEPLEELLEHEGAYGLVVMDGKEATVAILRGKQIKVLRKLDSTAHAKTHKGGQSAARYDRLREEGIEWYYKRVGEAMNSFVGLKNFQGVLVGGPGPVKEDFLKIKPFNYQLKVLGVVDTGYTDEYGLREVMEKAGDIIAEQAAIKENKLLDRFQKDVIHSGLATYGYDDVKKVLENNQAESLLVSEDLGLKKIVFKCSSCGREEEKIVDGTPEEFECGCHNGKMKVALETDVAEELEDLAEQSGVPVELISQDTAEGAKFKVMFHGIGAFLRYKL